MESQKAQFEALHRHYHAMVQQMCRSYLIGTRGLASDLAQDVFVNIWNALPRFRGESSHKTWIFRITVNTCLLHLRREKKRTHEPIGDMDVAEEPHHGTEREQLLYRAIGQLEKMDRLIVMMLLEDLDYEELARVVGISKNNLGVKIHRIKQRLKNILDHEQRN